jgi:hypothetical protein
MPTTAPESTWGHVSDHIYCNIATSSPSSYIVTLPYQIEKPIAVNLNTNPAFSRGQLFESTWVVVAFQVPSVDTELLKDVIPVARLL